MGIDGVHTPHCRAVRMRLPPLRGAATIPAMCGRYASFLPAEAIARIQASVPAATS
jgi:hypothetical protein